MNILLSKNGVKYAVFKISNVKNTFGTNNKIGKEKGRGDFHIGFRISME